MTRNKSDAPAKGTLQFRAANRQPELWDSVTGRIRDSAYRGLPGRVEVAIELPPNGSTFVIFRRPALRSTLPIEGEWSVEFEPNRGAPARITLPALTSWTRHADPGVRYFSGSAKYGKSFMLPGEWRRPGARFQVDLGRLWNIGEAWLNGNSPGVLWTAPFAADCTASLRDGENELVVERVNTWFNRLIGDARLPAAQ